jgi:hypothetical protein
MITLQAARAGPALTFSRLEERGKPGIVEGE